MDIWITFTRGTLITCQTICDTLQWNYVGWYVAYNKVQQDKSKVYFIEKGQLGYSLVGLTEGQTTFHTVLPWFTCYHNKNWL